MQDPLTLYKLIVLFMLNRVDFPLTRTQVSNFILDKGYTNFLTLQQVFSELAEANMIVSSTMRNRTFLKITEEGAETLSFFGNRIGDTIKQEITAYLKANELTLRDEISIQSDYYKAVNGDYEARLLAKEKGATLLEITLSVPTKEAASAVCDNWQTKNQKIYQYLMEQLF